MDAAVEISNSSEAVIANLQPTIISEAVTLTDNEVTNFINIMRYEDSLRERVQVEEATVREARAAGTEWSIGTGLYDHNIDTRPIDPRTKINEPLHGAESMMAAQLDDLLEMREGSGIPVVVLDFGGGIGLSMVRIAAQEKYKAAIERGDLVIAVTNLGYLPEEQPDEDQYTGIAKLLNRSNKRQDDPTQYSPDELRFVEENQQFVTYLDAHAAELATQAVTTRKGKRVQLSGHVDILHEQSAVAHTNTPDVALAVFSKLLSSNGTAYLFHMGVHPKVGNTTLADGRIIDKADPAYTNQRYEAWEVGKRVLQNTGAKTTVSRVSEYNIFTRAHAPRVNTQHTKQ